MKSEANGKTGYTHSYTLSNRWPGFPDRTELAYFEAPNLKSETNGRTG